ncbi:hypothetical protein [Cryptosporangium arvum]|uniref:hypothetical protein n=1 Tax=Cryptosporangium arvum TaxID=80871 RepID=UPI0004B5CE16|nr:hypothetical protein [Cryptosporangium arvum]
MSQRWLSRYLAGDRASVWHEMRQRGNAIRRDPELEDEAQQVCDEMARRARQNVEVIVERLTADGYRFHTNDDDRTPLTPHYPPTARASELVDWLDRRFGEVPLTLRAWARGVGDVWLVGSHPEWPTAAEADPLVCEVEGSRYPADQPMTDYYAGELEMWQETGDDRLLVLPLSPDGTHKASRSGGPPYGVIVPDGCADALFAAETTSPFVEYLNYVFRNGGFPRRTGTQNEWRIRHRLAKDLLPL